MVAKLFIPFILLFALFVQFHGELGPGGGFKAGVIPAAAMVLHALVFGLDNARKVVPERLVETMLAAGVLIYPGVGVAGLPARRQLPRLLRARPRTRSTASTAASSGSRRASRSPSAA